MVNSLNNEVLKYTLNAYVSEVEILEAGQSLDFSTEEDGTYWGFQKIRIFDGIIIVVGLYGGGHTYSMNIDDDTESSEIYDFLYDVLRDDLDSDKTMYVETTNIKGLD